MDDVLHILLARFRRRLMFTQAIRALAVASLGIAIVCLVAALLQRLTGTALLARSAVGGASVAGIWMVIRLRRRPTLAAAALEIDRQQNLHELLSSAAIVEDRDDLGACVVAAATKRASEVRVEELSAGDFGTPAWIATLLVVGLLPLAYRGPSSAGQAAAGEVGQVSVADREASRPDRARTRARGPQPIDTSPSQAPGASLIAMSSAADRQGQTATSPRPTRSDTAGTSAGGGLAQGQQSTPAAQAPVVAAAQGERGDGKALGDGGANASPSGTARGSGQVTSAGIRAEAGAGASASVQAEGTLDAQSIPEAYHDVLKAYFAR